MTDSSLDHWIGRLNAGDEEAVGQLLQAYEPYLRIAVRRRLSPRLRTKVDSGDIVQSVFADALEGFRKGGLQFGNRAQLFGYLQRIAARRLADRYEKHRHGLAREQTLSDAAPGGLPDGQTPRPSEVAQGRELWERVLATCPPAHQEIVRLRASGLRLGEIAARTGLHEGSVRRILYDLARRLSIARRTTRPDTFDD